MNCMCLIDFAVRTSLVGKLEERAYCQRSSALEERAYHIARSILLFRSVARWHRRVRPCRSCVSACVRASFLHALVRAIA